MANRENGLERALPALSTALSNALTRARNLVIDLLPGERPRWLVIELSGSYPARRSKRKLISLGALMGAKREQSQEELSDIVSTLIATPWLDGVVLRLEELRVDLATAYALRSQLQRLKAGRKRVVVTTSDLNSVTYYLASAADEIAAPEGASLWVHGSAITATFMAGALERFGVRFEKLAIDEYKNAGDQLALSEMSEPQRRQYDALLDSVDASYLAAVGSGRDRPAEEVRDWIDRGVTSAQSAFELGMIDRVAYEDELLGEKHQPYAAAARFLPARTRADGGGRVAVVSLEGNIVPGKSRRSPIPVPIFGERLAGSETLVRALRAAGRDPTTKAIVFHVDSGGGSAVASDLIWREVKLLAQRIPVVAVMGQLAASGGYYVLTHATRVLAAPSTITGSIGVVMGKFVLEEFNARYGLNPETLKRGRYAGMLGSSRPWDEAERELVERTNREVYRRFVERVAGGRGMTVERVNEIGRGRIWSGASALELGLVDEIGDVHVAVERAKELAGLDRTAPVWNVHAPQKLLLPADGDPQVVLRAWAPLLSEPVLLMHQCALDSD